MGLREAKWFLACAGFTQVTFSPQCLFLFFHPLLRLRMSVPAELLHSSWDQSHWNNWTELDFLTVSLNWFWFGASLPSPVSSFPINLIRSKTKGFYLNSLKFGVYFVIESFFMLKLWNYLLFIALPYTAIDPIVLNFNDSWNLEMHLHFIGFLGFSSLKKEKTDFLIFLHCLLCLLLVENMPETLMSW